MITLYKTPKRFIRRMYSSNNALTTTLRGTPWLRCCMSFLCDLLVPSVTHCMQHSLRHLEYYRGIMFLTTNRIKAFDEAFLSRIHVALHFEELSQASKEQVWTAFVTKVGASLTQAEIQVLASRGVNGRQIKNAARTAHSLAVGRGEKVALIHFMETLDAMDEFTKQFEAVRDDKL